VETLPSWEPLLLRKHSLFAQVVYLNKLYLYSEIIYYYSHMNMLFPLTLTWKQDLRSVSMVKIGESKDCVSDGEISKLLKTKVV
jgi:hypothetical protein